jgi:hypothetical protein
MSIFAYTLGVVISSSSASELESIHYHMEQAEHFLHRGWLDDAEAEYLTALALPGGSNAAALAELGARIAWRRLEVEDAMLRTQAFAALTGDPDQAMAAREKAETYALDFGFVEVVGSRSGSMVEIALSSKSLQIDPLLSEYGEQLIVRLSEPTRLPIRIALPAGEWELNGTALTVAPGREHSVNLSQARREPSTGPLRDAQLEVAPGLQMWMGPDMEGFSPSLRIGAHWLQPLGAVLLDTSLQLSKLRMLTHDQHVLTPPLDLGGQLHIGLPQSIGAIRLRPSLGAGLIRARALAVECESSEGALSCTHRATMSHPVVTIPQDTWLFLPGASVSIDYPGETREAVVGTGIRLSLDHVRGWSSSSGVVEELPSGAGLDVPTRWTTDEPGLRGWRFGLQVSITVSK